MYTLFIDTHYKDILICLYKHNELINSKTIIDSKSTSIETMPAIINVLNESNIKITDINKLAVIKGPGSFTGIRIGVTISKVLAYSLNIPIVTLTSLDLIGINIDNPSYIAVLENNAAFVTYYDSKVSEIKYYKKGQYEEFKQSNKVIEKIDIDYNKLIKYIDTLKSESPYDVNPLYVKTIEALNDKKN